MDERENREKRGSWLRQLKRSAADSEDAADGSCVVKKKTKKTETGYNNNFYNVPVKNTTNASYCKLPKQLIPISNSNTYLDNEDAAHDISNLYSYALQDHSPDPYLPRDDSPTTMCDLNFQHLESSKTSSAISPPTIVYDDNDKISTALSTSPQAPSKEKHVLDSSSLNLPKEIATASNFTSFSAPPENNLVSWGPNLSANPKDNASAYRSTSLTASPEKKTVLCVSNLPANPKDNASAYSSTSLTALPEKNPVLCGLYSPANPKDDASASSSTSTIAQPEKTFTVCDLNLLVQAEYDATTSSSTHLIAPIKEVFSATMQSSSSLTALPTRFTSVTAPLETTLALYEKNLPLQPEDDATAPSSSLLIVVPDKTSISSSPNLLAEPEEETCYILDEFSGVLYKAYICDICLKKFRYKKHIKKHIISVHLQKKIKKISKKKQSENRKNKKKLRASGKEYKTLKGKVIFSRTRRTFFCRKCPYKCTTSIEQQQMDSIFNNYWKLGEVNEDQDQQRQYISDHIDIIEPDRRRVKNNSRKQKTYVYYVTLAQKRLKVCRHFFLNVHGITEKFVRIALKKRIDDSGLVRPDCRGRHPAKNKTTLEDEQFARNHILSIPAVESHYCRKSTTRKYLPAELNMNKLYEMYKDNCKEFDCMPISISVYKKYFYGYNLSFHKPRKDTCNTCQLFESLPNEEKDEKKEEYQNHLKLKDRAREVKNEAVAKGKDNPSHCVLNFDMQAVLDCPKGKACAIFYKRKFSTYNLTIYDIISHQGVCNMWTEVEGNRGSIEVATCVYKHIESKVNKNFFYFFSDSCGGQNRNQFFATACVEAVRRLPHVHTIDHIFYEPGHSQQEGDSMHSTIERAAKNISINAPSEWVTICKIARKNPAPYQVQELSHEDFIDFKEVAKNNPIKKSLAISWLSIKWLRYSKAEPNKIEYRYDYDSPFMTMNVGTKPTLRGRRIQTELPKAYRERLPITKAKYTDLISLCKSGAISRNHHNYFKELPHSED